MKHYLWTLALSVLTLFSVPCENLAANYNHEAAVASVPTARQWNEGIVGWNLGNNKKRHLIVQTYVCNPDFGIFDRRASMKVKAPWILQGIKDGMK